MKSCDDGYPTCRKAEATGKWCKAECESAAKRPLAAAACSPPIDEPVKLTVIAVRGLKKAWTLERVPKLRWSCTVTFAPMGDMHKPATLDMDQDDVDKIPECGDVLLVIKPRVVGYFSPENAEVSDRPS